MIPVRESFLVFPSGIIHSLVLVCGDAPRQGRFSDIFITLEILTECAGGFTGCGAPPGQSILYRVDRSDRTFSFDFSLYRTIGYLLPALPIARIQGGLVLSTVSTFTGTDGSYGELMRWREHRYPISNPVRSRKVLCGIEHPSFFAAISTSLLHAKDN